MRKYLLCCVLFLVIVAFAAGCRNWTNQVETDEGIMMPDQTNEESLGETTALYEAVSKENPDELGEVITSKDNLYQVLIPSGWELCENKIEESMLFEFQGETEDRYIGILPLEEETYGEFTISAFMDAYIENARVQYGDAVIGEKVPEEVNGRPAYSLRLTGVLDETDYVNLLYAVEYENEKVIFTASMYPENETAVQRAMTDLVYSFQRTDDRTEE